MPGLDGQALYHRLKQSNAGLAKRVIFVTGDTLNTKTREFLDATGNLWLSKPFRIQEVLDRVQQVLIPAAGAVEVAGQVTAGCVRGGG
jgi:two-component system cell cycle sensor histidine kinase/response regulator CckA